MSFSNPTPRICLFLLFIAVLSSCVKDIDLDQAKNITAQPDLEVDLFYLEVDQVGFSDSTSTFISDPIPLEFKDKKYIQKVEFSFKCINSFPQSFNASIRFLAEDNSVEHPINFSIAPGTVAHPETTYKIHEITENKIDDIHRSVKMVVEIEAVGPFSTPVTGELKIQSKGLFSFKFNL